MYVLICEPKTMWAKCFSQNLQRVADTHNSPYCIVRPGTNRRVDFVVIDLDDGPIEVAHAILHRLRVRFPRSGIVSVCEDIAIEPIADSLGVHNAYSETIVHTNLWPRFTHRFLQVAQVAAREHYKIHGHRS